MSALMGWVDRDCFGLAAGFRVVGHCHLGAGEWMVVQGRRIQDLFHDKYDRPRPWLAAESDELSGRLVGHRVRSIDVRRHCLRIVFENEVDLTIEEASDHRLLFEGTKKPAVHR
jgi:hypothetical protein